MHILNGFNAEMCLGLTVTLITAPHTDKYAIATIKSYPIMGKIFLYLINKSIKGGGKVLTMVHFLKKSTSPEAGDGLDGGWKPFFRSRLQLFLITLKNDWGFFFPSKPLLLVFCIVPISCFCITREKADTLKNEEQGSVYSQESSLRGMGSGVHS